MLEEWYAIAIAALLPLTACMLVGQTNPYHALVIRGLDAIAALLSLTACMLVGQTNPYHALVIRGIVGAVAALVYAILGAADVALTEALVGTMLSITLYAVAVRSSLSMRLGIVEDEETQLAEAKAVAEAEFPLAKTENLARLCLPEPLRSNLRQALGKHYLRLELVGYPNQDALNAAFQGKEIHATCAIADFATTNATLSTDNGLPQCYLQTRVARLYEILEAGLPPSLVDLSYISPSDLDPVDRHSSQQTIPAPAESHQ